MLIGLFSLSVYAKDITIKYYYKTNCSWCDKQKPILNQLKGVKIIPINMDNYPMPTPTMRIVVDGKVVKTFVGYTDYSTLVSVIKSY